MSIDPRPTTASGGASAHPAPSDDGVGSAELDVRTLPHADRHEVIFGQLEALTAGEVFVIRNDHDPRPLRYQTEALWPGAFSWSYLESGPVEWRVAIARVA